MIELINLNSCLIERDTNVFGVYYGFWATCGSTWVKIWARSRKYVGGYAACRRGKLDPNNSSQLIMDDSRDYSPQEMASILFGPKAAEQPGSMIAPLNVGAFWTAQKRELGREFYFYWGKIGDAWQGIWAEIPAHVAQFKCCRGSRLHPKDLTKLVMDDSRDYSPSEMVTILFGPNPCSTAAPDKLPSDLPPGQYKFTPGKRAITVRPTDTFEVQLNIGALQKAGLNPTFLAPDPCPWCYGALRVKDDRGRTAPCVCTLKKTVPEGRMDAANFRLLAARVQMARQPTHVTMRDGAVMVAGLDQLTAYAVTDIPGNMLRRMREGI